MIRATLLSLVLVLTVGLAACSSGYGYGGGCCATYTPPCASPCASPCAVPGMTGTYGTYGTTPASPSSYSSTMPAPTPADYGAPDSGAASPRPPSESTVTIEDRAYAPQSLTVFTGTTVRWINHDAMPHSATGDGFDVELPSHGEGTHTFTNPGTFDVHCRYHPSMHSQVVVKQPEVK